MTEQQKRTAGWQFNYERENIYTASRELHLPARNKTDTESADSEFDQLMKMLGRSKIKCSLYDF